MVEQIRSPFRQQALEYISTPKALDDIVQISSPLAWALALSLWIILGTFISWLIFGSIATHMSAKGILLSKNEAILYVSALEMPNLKLGMSVSATPIARSQWKYKRVVGQITKIENFPATPAEMMVELKNSSLVSYFLQAGPVIILHLQIFSNDSLAPGTLIDARITAHRQSPLSLLFSR